jgi:hypothetical protein
MRCAFPPSCGYVSFRYRVDLYRSEGLRQYPSNLPLLFAHRVDFYAVGSEELDDKPDLFKAHANRRG